MTIKPKLLTSNFIFENILCLYSALKVSFTQVNYLAATTRLSENPASKTV